MKVKWLVVHTSASASAGKVLYPTVDDVRAWHKAKGWKDIGYHWFIEGSGALKRGRPESLAGAHVMGLNQSSVGVCVSGHGDFAAFTPEQAHTLITLLVDKCVEHGIDESRVIGHREVAHVAGAPDPHKTCPGILIDMNALRLRVAEGLSKTAPDH